VRPSLWFGCGQRLRCVIGRRSRACPTREEAAAFAHALPAGIPEASYTQWEYFLALHHGKECLLFLAQDAYEPNEATSHGDDFPDLQREFVERIKCSVPSPPPDMQRVQPRADLIASLHRSDVRSALQAGQHSSYQVPIRGGLGNAKPPRGPTQNLVVVGLGRIRQADRPMVAPHSDGGPSTFSARLDKCVRST
jgi:hypothetical protein